MSELNWCSQTSTGVIKAVDWELRVQRGGAACHGAGIWLADDFNSSVPVFKMPRWKEQGP